MSDITQTITLTLQISMYNWNGGKLKLELFQRGTKTFDHNPCPFTN